MADATQHPCDEGVIRGREADAPCEKDAKPWILAATILGSSMVFINGSTVNVALPALQRGLGATVVDIQWVLNAYLLLLASLILLGGSLGDHYGRKRVFMIGVALFTAASVWCGLAPSAGQLIAARAVQGVGGALLTPGSLAIISASFGEGERGRAIGLWSGFSAITSALGPVLGGWLIDTLSWRWIFFLNVPLAALVLVLCFWRVPESRDEEATGGLDWWGAALVSLGLGGLTYGLIESSNRGFGAPSVLGALLGGAVLLVVFLFVEARRRAPMVPLALFRSSTFSGANGLTLLLYAALGGALFFFPLNLIQVQGYSATAAGAALLPMILLLSVLSSWAGGLVSRVGAKGPLVVGPLVAAAGFFLFTLPGVGGSYWTTFFPAVLVLGLGLAVSVAPLTTAVMGAVPQHYAGTASGINNAVSRVANLLAIAALGLVMLGVFGGQFESRLAGLELPTETRESLLAQRTDLANIEAPENLGESARAAVENAVNEAFVAGFRVVMWVAVGLAIGSAVVAFLTVEGKVLKDAEDG